MLCCRVLLQCDLCNVAIYILRSACIKTSYIYKGKEKYIGVYFLLHCKTYVSGIRAGIYMVVETGNEYLPCQTCAAFERRIWVAGSTMWLCFFLSLTLSKHADAILSIIGSTLLLAHYWGKLNRKLTVTIYELSLIYLYIPAFTNKIEHVYA